MRDLEKNTDVALGPYDKLVIGASVRYGRHRSAVVEFMNRRAPALQAKPNAFFSVNVVARKSGKDRPETNYYLQQFLRRLAWRPAHLAVFAGKIDYPRYGFIDRLVIRFIMWITRGPTAPDAVVEYTDWQAVETFAGTIARM